LKILKEVAGSNVYDEKKAESGVILRETDEKRQAVAEVLRAIEQRLVQLELEKEELKEFQKWDKMKRSIEYTVHNKELEQTQNKLNELQRLRTDNSTSSNELYERLSEIGEQTRRCERAAQELRAKQSVAREELEQLATERAEYLARRARLELAVRDGEEEARQAKVNAELGTHELTRVQRLIDQSEAELADLVASSSEYAKLVLYIFLSIETDFLNEKFNIFVPELRFVKRIYVKSTEFMRIVIN
jgi:structural maintenance of chromosome 3 (chondroitin sulfate proteoglycan 6)